MARIAPPQATWSGDRGGDDHLSRLRFHLWQLSITAVTVGVTAWFCTLGIIPALLALMVAKHVLVALLVMNLEVGATRKREA